MKENKVIERIAFSVFLFSLLGWVYVVLVSFLMTNTLSMQLTHLTPGLRTDTFGILCFIVSFISFLVWNLLRE